MNDGFGLRRQLVLLIGICVLGGTACNGETFGRFLQRSVTFGHPAQTVSESEGPVAIEVRLDPIARADVDVSVGVSGSAELGSDFVLSPAAVVIPEGHTSAEVAIELIDDALSEGDETVVLSLVPGESLVAGAYPTFTLDVIDNESVSDLELSIPDAAVPESAGTVELVVTLSVPSGQLVAVDYQTRDDSAVSGADFTATGGTLNFLPGEVSQTISIPVATDSQIEGTERFFVDLSNPSGAVIADGEAVVTLFDVDTIPRVDVADAQGGEPDGSLDVSVTLSAQTGLTVSVELSTMDVTASAPADYAAFAGTLIFAPGETAQTVTIALVDDADPEGTETFDLALSNAGGGTLGMATATARILDDDAPVTLGVDDATVSEADGAVMVRVALFDAHALPVTVDFSTADGTARVTDGDYVAASGGLTFAPGQTELFVSVDVLQDTAVEGTEDFEVRLANPTVATFGRSTAVVTLLDDDIGTTLDAADASVAENVAGGTVDVAVTLTQAVGYAVTVDFATADGTAADPADYLAASGSLTFVPGVTSQSVTVAIVDDALPETPKDFTVQLSNPAPAGLATLGAAAATVTILDDDFSTAISIADATAGENDGTVDVDVTLTAPVAFDVTVDFATADGSALDPGDYAQRAGTLTFTAGQTTQTITLTLVDDALPEMPETLTVSLSNNSPAGLSAIIDADATVTILDDDITTTAAAVDAVVAENVASGTVDVSVTLSVAVAYSVSVDYATADGTATDPADYLGQAGTLTFTAGQTLQTVTLNIADDAAPEVPETFTVGLSNAMPAGQAMASAVPGTVTILDDDISTAVSVADATVGENDPSGRVDVVLSLSPAVAYDVTVDWSTADGSATSPADYVASAGTVTFTAGVTSQTASIPLTDDMAIEGVETFDVNLAGPTPAMQVTVADPLGTVTVLDDDTSVDVSVAGAVVGENDPSGNATVTVTLSLPVAYAVTVDVVTADGTASAPGDYTSSTLPVTVPPGQTMGTGDIPLVNDSAPELPEDFTVSLQNPAPPAQVNIVGGPATVTILDDDINTTVNIADASVAEDAGTVAVGITLTTAVAYTVTVDFTTTDGSATSPGDFAAGSSTVTFLPGVTSQSATITITDDGAPETPETFTVSLANPSPTPQAAVGTAISTVTILDDDISTALSIADVTVAENDPAGTVTLTVTQSVAVGYDVTLDWITAAGTATTPGDFIAGSGVVVIPAGSTSATFTVTVVDDGAPEVPETFDVNLSNSQPPAQTSFADATGTVTILDDDTTTDVSVAGTTVGENDPSGMARVVVSLTTAVAYPVTVDVVTADGTATAPADYANSTIPVVFAPGQTAQNADIPIVDDAAPEGPETFAVSLTAAAPMGQVNIVGGPATVTLLDDDITTTVDIADASVAEDAGTVAVGVTLTTAVAYTVTVDYATADGSATDPADYLGQSGTVTFLPGVTAQSITLTIADDGAPELPETFTVSLASPAPAAQVSIGSGTGTVTVLDDDIAVTLSIADETVGEDDASGAVNLTVTQSVAVGYDVTFDYATVDGSAAAPGDFAAASGSVTITAGNTSASFPVSLVDDGAPEGVETFDVNLSNGQPMAQTSFTDASATVTILDDDTNTIASVAGTTVGEDDPSGVAQVVVSLSTAVAYTVSVDLDTANGSATAPADYTAVSTTVIFTPGQTARTVDIPLVDDAAPEVVETFTVALSNPAPVAQVSIAGGPATVSILDDDRNTAINIADATVAENVAGGAVSVTVTLTAAVAYTVTVDYGTADGSATDPGDYLGSSGTLSFAPGTTVQSVNIPIADDGAPEVPETFTVNLSNPTPLGRAFIVTGTATVTVLDDDISTNISIADATIGEDDASGQVSLTVSLSVAVGYDVSFDYATADGSATAPADYTAASGTLTILAGGTTAAVVVTLIDDAAVEPVETFDVDLSNNQPVAQTAFTDANATVTLLDDDTNVTLSIADDSGLEDAGPLGFVVSISQAVSYAVDIDYATAGGTAISGTDFSAASGTLTIPPGATSGTLNVTLSADTLDEDDEGFVVDLSNEQPPAKVTVTDNQGAGTILDDDLLPDVDFFAAITNQLEAATSVNVVVTLSTLSGRDVTVPFTVGGTATGGGTDYSITASPITIPAGSLTANIVVTVATDALYENDETVVLDLVGPVINGNLAGTLQHTFNITNDDLVPDVDFTGTDASVGENVGTVTLTVQLSAVSGLATTIPFVLTASTATDPADYTVTASPVVIPAGSSTTDIIVTVMDDTLFEVDEDVVVDLGIPTNANLGSVTIRTVTIVSDDLGTAPFVLNVSPSNANTIVIEFSEPVDNGQATTLSNYTLIEDPTESGCAGTGSDTIALTGTVTALSTTRYALTNTNLQCSTTTYRLTASTNITDVDEGLNLVAPLFATFLGDEQLNISGATCVDDLTVDVQFSKDVETGTGAGGAQNLARYSFSGAVSLGAIVSISMQGTDTVRIVHTNPQTGGVFSVVGSNGIDGDGFDDAAIGAIEVLGTAEALQASPGDRVLWTGCGNTIENFDDGPVITDPFADSSDFGFLTNYFSRVYIGPNATGHTAGRFDPDGSNPQVLDFRFNPDSNHRNTGPQPFVSIGHTGCTPDDTAPLTGCGPDDEDGRGLFFTGTLGGVEHLFIGGARSAPGNNFDYIYYTADTDTTLNFSYLDLGNITGTNSNGLSSATVLNDYLYFGIARGPTRRPDLGRLSFNAADAQRCMPTNDCDAADGQEGDRMYINEMIYFGRQNGTQWNGAYYGGVDVLHVFNDRIYAANGGHHFLNRNGTIIRSVDNTPVPCIDGTDICNGWTEVGPRGHAEWHNGNTRWSLELTRTYDLEPQDRAFASMANFNGNMFAIRTTCAVAQSGTATDGAAHTTAGCTDGTFTNRESQLWKCTPGVDLECDTADWSLVGDDGTGVTDFGDSNNHSATLLVANGAYLYLGFNNPNGVRIYRTNVVDPSVNSTEWAQIGSQGLGDPSNVTELHSAISVQQGLQYYIYVSGGQNGVPVRVYRQANN